MGLNFGQTARSAAIAWKQSTSVLPEEAREPADWVRDDASVMHGPFDFCLPFEYAERNLLPEAELALELFAKLGIAWPGGIEGGPGNHLLDTWVQCANALVPLMADAERLGLLLRGAVPVAEVLEVEPGWMVTFGWSGAVDHLGDEGGGVPPRGPEAGTTAHAAVRYRTTDGATEVALLHWCYAESYLGATPDAPRKLAALASRYQRLANGAPWPLLAPGVSLADLLVAPFDRLARLHLLAREMEKVDELGAGRVRVVLVAPGENLDLSQSLTLPSHRTRGDTVADVWRASLSDEEVERFVTLDSSILVDPALDLTTPEFRSRYADLIPKSGEAGGGNLAERALDGADQRETGSAISWDRRRRRS